MWTMSFLLILAINNDCMPEVEAIFDLVSARTRQKRTSEKEMDESNWRWIWNVRNNWTGVKVTAGNSPLAFVRGGPMFAGWSTRKLTDFERIGYNADCRSKHLNGECLNFRLCNRHYLVQSWKCENYRPTASQFEIPIRLDICLFLSHSYHPFKDKAQTALFKDPVRTAL